MDYRQSGVDIEAGNETVRRIKSLARATFTSGVLSDIGSFGGLFRLDRDRCRDPVLVSSADGVGTKLKDRKSTRLNSSHSQISYAVFCLKKKKTDHNHEEDSYETTATSSISLPARQITCDP